MASRRFAAEMDLLDVCDRKGQDMDFYFSLLDVVFTIHQHQKHVGAA